MRRSRFPFHAALLCATLCALALFIAPAKAEDKSSAMVQYEALSKDFVKLRDMDAKRLGPQQLMEAAESLEGKVQKLVDSAAGDPSAKSKAQELLSMTLEFDGKMPEAKAAYGAYLDTLEAWQGRDYAVMVARRAGDRLLQQGKKAASALSYYDQLLEKYPDHPSRAYAFYQSGLACMQARNYAEAARRFDQTATVAPESGLAPWALRRKAFALSEMVPAGGDFAEALATLETLAQRYPTPHWKAYAYFRRGYLYAWQTKYLEAIVEYSKGIAAEPSDEYSEMGRKHIAQIQKIMEREVLDKLARENEPLDGKETPTAASSLGHGPMSMLSPIGDERLGEGQQ